MILDLGKVGKPKAVVHIYSVEYISWKISQILQESYFKNDPIIADFLRESCETFQDNHETLENNIYSNLGQGGSTTDHIFICNFFQVNY